MGITMLARSLVLFGLQVMTQGREMDLSRKLAGFASATVAFGMAIAATIASNYVNGAMAHRYAAATALYMDSFVTPYVQELATKSTLSQVNRELLETLFAPTTIGRPVVGFRIWSDDRIIFSNDRDMIGRSFDHSSARSRAWAGEVAADLDSLDSEDDVQILALGIPILEVYAPVRQTGTGQIIALVETFEIATNLKMKVWAAQVAIWMVLGVGALGTTVLLFGLAGSRAQEVTRLHYENEQYRARVGGANRRVSEMNELHMYRIGRDLDEGPMQLVGLALLKLDSLHQIIAKMGGSHDSRGTDVETIRTALNKSLDEIRSLSASLVPSKIKTLSLAETIMMAARRHEWPNGGPAACSVGVLPTHIPFSVKACIYRFVQDGLEYFGNKFDCYTLRATSLGDEIEVEIVSNPSAMPAGAHGADTQELMGSLRDRVEVLGGAFFVRSQFGRSSLTARFNVGGGNPANG